MPAVLFNLRRRMSNKLDGGIGGDPAHPAGAAAPRRHTQGSVVSCTPAPCPGAAHAM